MTDFRALCAELLDALENAISVIRGEGGTKTKHISTADAVITKADAALAQPEPQGPTDAQIMELMPNEFSDDLASAASCVAGTSTKIAGACRVVLNAGAVSHCRAVLARWSRPAIEPVPVSKRLPGPEDCDAEGRCWIGTWNHIEDEDVFELLFDWSFTSPRDWTWSGIAHIQYWLPHWALPVPGVEGADG
jgi:hypothetical protein